MKDAAFKWYSKDPSDVEKLDWSLLKECFGKEFWKAGNISRAMARLRRVRMKKGETLRQYSQNLRTLLDKISPAPSPIMQVEYFIGGLPSRMNRFCRQATPTTLKEAIESARHYEEAEMSQEKQLKKEEKAERRGRLRKRGRAKERSTERILVPQNPVLLQNRFQKDGVKRIGLLTKVLAAQTLTKGRRRNPQGAKVQLPKRMNQWF